MLAEKAFELADLAKIWTRRVEALGVHVLLSQTVLVTAATHADMHRPSNGRRILGQGAGA